MEALSLLFSSALFLHVPTVCSLAWRLTHPLPILEVALLASAGLLVRAAMYPQAQQPGCLGTCGPWANLPGMLQEEGPHLAASGAKWQPDTPSSVFPPVSLWHRPGGKVDFPSPFIPEHFTLPPREAGVVGSHHGPARCPPAFSPSSRKPPNQGEKMLPLSLLGSELPRIQLLGWEG